jgi:hypothetical protein
MPVPWPDGDEIFSAIEHDLLPLIDAYPPDEDEAGGDPEDEELRLIAHHNRLKLPDGLFPEDEIVRLSGADIDAVPWEYTVPAAPMNRRGRVDHTKPLTIRGTTITHPSRDSGEQVFRRYVDWAGVWAQLGVSAGRGEDGEQQLILGPDGVEIETEEG